MYKEIINSAFDKQSPNTEMSEMETNIMLSVLLSKDKTLQQKVQDVDFETEYGKKLKGLVAIPQVQVFLKRLELLTTLNITMGALILISQHFQNMGESVMYCYYLKYKLPENTLITPTTIAQTFPWGFFSKEQLKEIWDAQKVKGDYDISELSQIGAHDNLLDYKEVW